MRVAGSTDGRTFGEPNVRETPEDYEDGVAAFTELVEETLDGAQPTAFAGGLAGPMSEYKEYLVRAPHLPGWIEKPFKQHLEQQFNVPALLENDSAMVALGEAHAGAGVGYRIVAYITVSTGVGGARIVSGEIDHASVGFEPGHQIIDMDKSILPEASGVRLEQYVSGSSVAARTGQKAYEITDAAFWEELARMLAYGLNNTIVHWSPQVLVLGGSMIVGDPAIPVERVEHHLREILDIFPDIPNIKPAALGDYGGLHGALARLRVANIL